MDVLVACTNKLNQQRGKEKGEGGGDRDGERAREITPENLIRIGKGIGHRA